MSKRLHDNEPNEDDLEIALLHQRNIWFKQNTNIILEDYV